MGELGQVALRGQFRIGCRDPAANGLAGRSDLDGFATGGQPSHHPRLNASKLSLPLRLPWQSRLWRLQLLHACADSSGGRLLALPASNRTWDRTKPNRWSLAMTLFRDACFLPAGFVCCTIAGACHNAYAPFIDTEVYSNVHLIYPSLESGPLRGREGATKANTARLTERTGMWR